MSMSQFFSKLELKTPQVPLRQSSTYQSIEPTLSELHISDGRNESHLVDNSNPFLASPGSAIDQEATDEETFDLDRYMRACQHEPLKLSELSSFTVPNSLFHAQDLQLGAGVVIIQPSTDNVVVLYSEKSKRYFLPKGRKDVGESIQDTAIREGYEESGYRCEPLPLIIHHNCPNPNANPLILCHNPPSTEAIAITMFHARPRRFRSRAPEPTGTEYLTFWYVAQIGPDAVMEQNTKMPDEVEYVTNLMSWDEAIQCLSRNGPESHLQVLKIAQMLWRQTQAVQARSRLPFRSLTIDTLSSAGASSGNSTPRSSWSFDKFRFPWKK